jgi:hypothetical protein
VLVYREFFFLQILYFLFQFVTLLQASASWRLPVSAQVDFCPSSCLGSGVRLLVSFWLGFQASGPPVLGSRHLPDGLQDDVCLHF